MLTFGQFGRCVALISFFNLFAHGFITRNINLPHKRPSSLTFPASSNGIDMTLLGKDWREARARMLAGTDDKWEQQLSRNTIDNFRSLNLWAHELISPEQGGLAIASAFTKSDKKEKAYMDQAVVLLTYHDDFQGSAGLILNRPTSYCIGDVLTGPEVGPFSSSPLFLGGEDGMEGDITFMHRFPTISGAREIIPGICIGGDIFEAASLVNNGLAHQEDFRFFLQHLAWMPDRLKWEVEQKNWYLAACSKELLLIPQQIKTPFWRELMRLLGGKYSLYAREVYQEL